MAHASAELLCDVCNRQCKNIFNNQPTHTTSTPEVDKQRLSGFARFAMPFQVASQGVRILRISGLKKRRIKLGQEGVCK